MLSSPAQPSARAPTGRGARACLASVWVLLLAALLAAQTLAAPAGAQVPGLPAPEAEAPPPEDESTVAEALRLLALVLEDPEARAALIAQLRDVEPAAPADRPALPDPEALIDPTVAQAIAEQTMDIAESLGDQLRGVLRDLLAVTEIVELGRAYDLRAEWPALAPVVAVILAVLVAIWLLKLATRPMLSRFEGSAIAAETALAPFRWKFFGLLLEIARVPSPGRSAFAVAFLISDGNMPIEVGIFLSAFLWVEAARGFARVILRPRHPELRMIRMSDAHARHWSFWLARIIGVLGYGILFLAPLAAQLGADRLADWLMLAAATVSMVMGTALILRNRVAVREGLASPDRPRVRRHHRDMALPARAALAPDRRSATRSRSSSSGAPLPATRSASWCARRRARPSSS
jgi:moderate conductance mechanosensitive channel